MSEQVTATEVPQSGSGFPLDLRKIVVSNWSQFRHVFSEQARFSDRLEQLNQIRRCEAHNRELSEQDIQDLDAIHSELMTSVAQVVPDAASNYLLENWRNCLSEIFGAATKSCVEVVPVGTPTLGIEAVRRQIERFEDVETQIAGVSPPPAMRSVHNELLTPLSGVRMALMGMIRLETVRDAGKLHDAQLRFESANRNRIRKQKAAGLSRAVSDGRALGVANDTLSEAVCRLDNIAVIIITI